MLQRTKSKKITNHKKVYLENLCEDPIQMSELIQAYKEYYMSNHNQPWDGDILDKNYLLDVVAATDLFQIITVRWIEEQFCDDEDQIEAALKGKEDDFQKFKDMMFAHDTIYLKDLVEDKYEIKMHPFMAGVLSERALRLYDIKYVDKALK